MQCPLCGGSTRRFGFNRNGSQRYRCDPCGHTFTDKQSSPRDRRRLTLDKEIFCLRHLLEGTSIRSTERLLDVQHATIIRAAVAAGTACQSFLETIVRDVDV